MASSSASHQRTTCRPSLHIRRSYAAPMSDWGELRFFLAVCRTGSLAAAARRLRVDPTTVGRHIQALERSLDARLFDRTPAGWRPTEVGRRIRPSAEAMEASWSELELAAEGTRVRAAGNVRLTTLEVVASHVIAPALPRFRAQWPEITLEIITTARTLRLDRAEADVALRLVRPREETLVGRRVGVVEQALYGSRDYLERHGTPTGPALGDHDALAYSEAPFALPGQQWLLDRPSPPRVTLRVISVSTLLQATRAGVGLAVLPRLIADRTPELVRLDAVGAPPGRDLWRVVHRDLAQVARVRALLDFLDELF